MIDRKEKYKTACQALEILETTKQKELDSIAVKYPLPKDANLIGIQKMIDRTSIENNQIEFNKFRQMRFDFEQAGKLRGEVLTKFNPLITAAQEEKTFWAPETVHPKWITLIIQIYKGTNLNDGNAEANLWASRNYRLRFDNQFTTSERIMRFERIDQEAAE